MKKDGFWAVATIRKDRLKGADKHLLAEKDQKKHGRGSFDFVVEANSGVTVIRWFDNGLVKLLSNYVGNNVGKHDVGLGRKGDSSTLIGQQWLSSTTATWMVSTCVTC